MDKHKFKDFGHKSKVVDYEGNTYNVYYKVFNLNELISSHRLAGTHYRLRCTKDIDFPVENPKDFSDCKNKLEEFASKVDLKRLVSDTGDPEGSPIVAGDNIVVSGNFRTLFLKYIRSFEQDLYLSYIKHISNSELLDNYNKEILDVGREFPKLWLEHKEDPDLYKGGFSLPILVRVIENDVEITSEFLSRFNKTEKNIIMPIQIDQPKEIFKYYLYEGFPMINAQSIEGIMNSRFKTVHPYDKSKSAYILSYSRELTCEEISYGNLVPIPPISNKGRTFVKKKNKSKFYAKVTEIDYNKCVVTVLFESDIKAGYFQQYTYSDYHKTFICQMKKSDEDKWVSTDKEFSIAPSEFFRQVWIRLYHSLVDANFDSELKNFESLFIDLGVNIEDVEDKDLEREGIKIAEVHSWDIVGILQASVETIQSNGYEQLAQKFSNISNDILDKIDPDFEVDSKEVKTDKKYDLGYGFMGNGITVWNREDIEDGDYIKVAHISDSGKVSFYDKDMPDAIKEEIEKEAEKHKEKIDKKREEDQKAEAEYQKLKSEAMSKRLATAYKRQNGRWSIQMIDRMPYKEGEGYIFGDYASEARAIKRIKKEGFIYRSTSIDSLGEFTPIFRVGDLGYYKNVDPSKGERFVVTKVDFIEEGGDFEIHYVWDSDGRKGSDMQSALKKDTYFSKYPSEFNVTKETAKLIGQLFKNGNLEYEMGDVLENEDGEFYRWDNYKLGFKNTRNWLANLFGKAAKSVNKEFSTQFTDGNGLWNFQFDRAKVIGAKHGKIRFSRIVVYTNSTADEIKEAKEELPKVGETVYVGEPFSKVFDKAKVIEVGNPNASFEWFIKYDINGEIKEGTHNVDVLAFSEKDFEAFAPTTGYVLRVEKEDPNSAEDFDQAIMSQIDPHDSWIGKTMKERSVWLKIYNLIKSGSEEDKIKETNRIFLKFFEQEKQEGQNLDKYTIDWIESNTGKKFEAEYPKSKKEDPNDNDIELAKAKAKAKAKAIQIRLKLRKRKKNG
jgi:hypothetical protein